MSDMEARCATSEHLPSVWTAPRDGFGWKLIVRIDGTWWEPTLSLRDVLALSLRSLEHWQHVHVH
jgi:hypothetical protein